MSWTVCVREENFGLIRETGQNPMRFVCCRMRLGSSIRIRVSFRSAALCGTKTLRSHYEQLQGFAMELQKYTSVRIQDNEPKHDMRHKGHSCPIDFEVPLRKTFIISYR